MGVDVLDLTSLQKRGILKIPREEESHADVMDLTQPTSSLPAPLPAPAAPSSDTSSAFDFLSSFAQSSAAEPARAPHESSGDVHAKLDTIINKIEDTMYKIEVLSGRVAQLETRFSQ